MVPSSSVGWCLGSRDWVTWSHQSVQVFFTFPKIENTCGASLFSLAFTSDPGKSCHLFVKEITRNCDLAVCQEIFFAQVGGGFFIIFQVWSPVCFAEFINKQATHTHTHKREGEQRREGNQRFRPKGQGTSLLPLPCITRKGVACQWGGGVVSMGGSTSVGVACQCGVASIGWLILVLTWLMASRGVGIHGG